MIKFGTSGFRGIIADNFTKENVSKVAYAIVKASKSSDVIPVGYDNRFLGKNFAIWMCEVFAAMGKKIKFFESPVPSPLIAYESQNTEFGIMISASHNPYFYNGIKIFQNGMEIPKKLTAKIEKIANKISYAKIKTIDFEEAVAKKIITLTTNIKPYCNSILKNVNTKFIKESGLKVYYNAMQGSSVECANYIFNKLNLNVAMLNTDVNPNFKFGLPAPYSDNIKDQKKLAKTDKTENFGFALDGDGDRISFLDENGVFYDCNYISALVYDDLLQSGNKFDFVKNCAMTSLVDKIAEKHEQKVILAEVGFKNIAQQMLKNPSAGVGSESNGFTIKNHIYYKDGLMGAVILLEVLAKKQLPLSKAIKKLKQTYKYPCEVVEYAYPFNNKQRSFIQKLLFEDKKLPKIPGLEIKDVSYADGLKIMYENGYWGVLRFSGNENVIRLFAEMPNKETCEKVIRVYEKFIKLKTRQV